MSIRWFSLAVRENRSPDLMMWGALVVVLGLWFGFFWILDLLQ